MDIRVCIAVILVVAGVVVAQNNDPVAIVCEPTDYKEVCKQSLNEVAPKGTTDPKELIKASVQAIINEIQSSLNFSASLIPNATEPRVGPRSYFKHPSNFQKETIFLTWLCFVQLKKSLESCNGLYQSAVENLQSALSFLGTKDLQNLNNQIIELQNWLSASLSFQTTCLDGVDDPKFKDMLANKASKARELNSNALAIIGSLPQVLNSAKKA